MDQQGDRFNTTMLSDHDLLLGGVIDLVEENKLNARKWAGWWRSTAETPPGTHGHRTR